MTFPSSPGPGPSALLRPGTAVAEVGRHYIDRRYRRYRPMRVLSVTAIEPYAPDGRQVQGVLTGPDSSPPDYAVSLDLFPRIWEAL